MSTETVPPPSGPKRTTRWALLLRDAGLNRPMAHWTQDLHWRAALWSAVPVWLGLGLLVGASLRAPVSAAAWLSLVVVQPLLEEVTVRGLVQGALSQWNGRWERRLRVVPVSQANLVTTALFVALHLNNQPWPWALAVALPSLLLGHIRERFGSAWPCVLAHAHFNAGFGVAACLAG